MHSSIFKEMARKALKGKWQKTAWIVFVGTLISGGIQLDAGEIKPTFQVNLAELKLTKEMITALLIAACVCLFLALLIGAVVNVGMYNLGSRLLDGEEPRMKMLFPRKVAFRAVAMNLLRALIVFGALVVVLLVSALMRQNLVLLAGVAVAYAISFYLSYCYDMADYLLLTNPKMGPLRALKESRMRLKGFKSQLFWLELSFVGWTVLSMLPPLVLMNVLEPISMQAAIVAGVASSLVCGVFVSVYQIVSRTAFFREVDNPDDGYARRRAEQQDAARKAYQDMKAEREAEIRKETEAREKFEYELPQDVFPSVDNDKARGMFFAYNCSRAAMHEAGVLEEYDEMHIDGYTEGRWVREYTDLLIRRFDRDAEALSDILRLAAEYAHGPVVDRALMRIDRHVRQESLPPEEILGMVGRILALYKTDRFYESPGYVNRKMEQIADIVNRIEETYGESDTIRKIREMM